MTTGKTSSEFLTVRRQEFRRYFQPSRIVLGLLRADTPSRVNVITLCFDMYCSYKPPMMAFAIQKGSYSHELLQEATECVLAVPGERLAQETLLCGIRSGRDLDKVQECNFPLIRSERIGVPGIGTAIANIELRISDKVHIGDHLTAFGEVLNFSVNKRCMEKCLLSVGPDTRGYRVLAKQGIHRIAVVDGPRNDLT